jgi:hypothetical protein
MSRRGTVASSPPGKGAEAGHCFGSEHGEGIALSFSKVARVGLGRLFDLGDYLADAVVTLCDNSWAICWCVWRMGSVFWANCLSSGFWPERSSV